MHEFAEMAGLPEDCPDPKCRRSGLCRAQAIDHAQQHCRPLWFPLLWAELTAGLIGVDRAFQRLAASARRTDKHEARSGSDADAR